MSNCIYPCTNIECRRACSKISCENRHNNKIQIVCKHASYRTPAIASNDRSLIKQVSK